MNSNKNSNKDTYDVYKPNRPHQPIPNRAMHCVILTKRVVKHVIFRGKHQLLVTKLNLEKGMDLKNISNLTNKF